MSDNAIVNCVQCGEKYKESENSPQSCHFHLNSLWGSRYQCCNRSGSEQGCQTNSHRSSHHFEYKYGTFLNLVSSILNYTNTHQEWHNIKLNNLETNNEFSASVGIINKNGPHWQNHLYIRLNSNWNFIAFSIDFIKNSVKNVKTADQRMIKSIKLNEDNENSSLEAQWAVDNKSGKIYGIYLTIKTASSGDDNPESALITFDVNYDKEEWSLKDIKTISKGNEWLEFMPNELYHNMLAYDGSSGSGSGDNNTTSSSTTTTDNDNNNNNNNKNSSVFITTQGASVDIDTIKEVHTQFKSKNKFSVSGVLSKDLLVKQKSMKCNERGFSYNGDTFTVELSITNKNSNKDWCFHELSGIYKYANDEKWSYIVPPSDDADGENKSNNNNNNGVSGALGLCLFESDKNYYKQANQSMPFTIDKGKGQTKHVKLDIFLPFSENGSLKPSQGFHNKSFLARFEPIMFKIKLIEMESDESIIVNTFFSHDNNQLEAMYGVSETMDNITFYMQTFDPSTFKKEKIAVKLVDSSPNTSNNNNNNNDNDDSVKTGESKVDEDSSNNTNNSEIMKTFKKLEIKMNGRYVERSIDDLRSMVYKAKMKNEKIIKIDLDNDNNNIKYECYAYIDFECQRVYQFKFVMITQNCKGTGMYILPIYGCINEKKKATIVSKNEEKDYFGKNESNNNNNNSETFELSGDIKEHFELGTNNVLQLKRVKRLINESDFDSSCGNNNTNNDNSGSSVGTRSINMEYNGDIGKWANDLAEQFETMAKILRAFPGNNKQ